MTNLTVPGLQLKSSPGYTLPAIDLTTYPREDLHKLRRALYAPKWVGFFEKISAPEYDGSGFMCWELDEILGNWPRLARIFYAALVRGSVLEPGSVRACLQDQGMEDETSARISPTLLSSDPRVINARREWHRHLRDHLDAILKED